MSTAKLKHDLVGRPSSDVPTTWINSGNYVNSVASEVNAFAQKALSTLPENGDEKTKAIRLFDAVRDDIRYNPYQLSFAENEYQSDYIANLGAAYCVPKAILLAACLRSIGIPAGVGFADVKNHLNSAKLADVMETNLFMYHGYVALRLGDETFKVTPTFNQELCERFGVRAIEFDGASDALFHEFDADKRQHMEYVKDRGIFEDPPIPQILEDMAIVYPKMKQISDGAVPVSADPEFAA